MSSKQLQKIAQAKIWKFFGRPPSVCFPGCGWPFQIGRAHV